MDRRDLVEGLGKGLRVIEAFGDEHPQLSASQAASRTSLTRTAARRYLLSLVHCVRQALALGYSHTEQQLDAGMRGVAVALL